MADYKLVPIEPTPEMLEAGEYAQYTGCYVSGIYADMLAAAPDMQGEPVSAQVRYRRPEKGQPDWSIWQPAAVMLDRPSWEIDSQGWEVEYRLLYAAPQPATPRVKP